MGPGQRYSVIVTAHNTAKFNYIYNVTAFSGVLTRSAGLQPRHYTGLVEYSNNAPIKNIPATSDEDLVWPEEADLEALDKQSMLPVDRTIELDVVQFKNKHHVPFWTLGSSQYQPASVPTLYTALSMGDLASNSSIYGPQTNAYVLKHLEVVEVVIRNPLSNDHTFHFHGHNVQIIETGPCGTSDKIKTPPLPRRQSGLQPIRRDTIRVRGLEYIRVRFRADNPGSWFVHCHHFLHGFSGLAVVFVEAPDVLQQRQKVPVEMLQMCERQGIKTSGNGAAPHNSGK
ncbi:ferroxidase fet3 [Coemansia sp. RSA 2618]|nr:ferroxidase fet3 [Coemansia sp. RSA 2618]